MKFNIHKTTLSGFFFTAFLLVTSLLQGCSDDEETKKWVDLRYRVEDSYSLEAKNPEPISFLVKSTDPWEVFGKYDWHIISPNAGKAEEKYTVTITCEENTNLDDRTDTITIKSYYWVGKQFVITQKGIAYLNTGEPDIIPQTGGKTDFNIQTNQKWTAEITEGEKWLSIQGSASGELDGKITIQASINKGEQRTGIVTIYDRHGKIAQEVSCRQEGVILEPETPANGKFYTILDEAQQFKIHIESNTEWEVSKQNEKEDDWYTFEETSFNGSGDLILNVERHVGTSVRTGVMVLSTKAGEGTEPITKIIRFKQANPPTAKEFEYNKTFSTSLQYGPEGLMPGEYTFYFEPLGNTDLKFFFSWKKEGEPTLEMRFHIIGGITTLSTTPWCGNVGSVKVKVDTGKELRLGINVKEAVDKIDPTKSWIYTEWVLNGEVIAKATADGVTETGGTDSWIGPYERTETGARFLYQTGGGTAKITKYTYVGPPEWGE